MAARLNKKYFGNRNIGSSSTTADDGIGGEGVGSVTITAVGSYTSALPTVSFSTPDIPTGVRALGTVHGKALSAVATAAGSGYHLADVLAVTGSGTGTSATFNVTGLVVTSITLNNGGSANDVNDEFTFSIAGFATPLRVRVTAASGGVATAVSIVNGGVWTSGALPTNTIGMTRAQVAAGQDWNGTGLQVNITGWGVATVGVATEGDYTAISSGAKATIATPTGGTSATLTITYGIKSVAIDEKGSGYTTVADALPTFSAGSATGASVLTTDNGTPYSPGNQENALLPYAFIGGSRKLVDIIGQKGARRYKVTDGTNVAVCLLKTSGAASAVGEMDLTATDSAGGQYWVKKLNNRRCTVVVKSVGGGTQFATDTSVPWTFDSATLNTTVKISDA